jgi:hypothetical protein
LSAFEQETQKRDHREHANPEEAELSHPAGTRTFRRHFMVMIQDGHLATPDLSPNRMLSPLSAHGNKIVMPRRSKPSFVVKTKAGR